VTSNRNLNLSQNDGKSSPYGDNSVSYQKKLVELNKSNNSLSRSQNNKKKVETKKL
jgi:hypothetical protein